MVDIVGLIVCLLLRLSLICLSSCNIKWSHRLIESSLSVGVRVSLRVNNSSFHITSHFYPEERYYQWCDVAVMVKVPRTGDDWERRRGGEEEEEEGIPQWSPSSLPPGLQHLISSSPDRHQPSLPTNSRVVTRQPHMIHLTTSSYTNTTSTSLSFPLFMKW